MNYKKLYRYSLNELTDSADIEEVTSWIESSHKNRKEYATLKNLWAISSFENYDAIDLEEKPQKQEGRIIGILKRSVKYAAVFVLAFILGTTTFYYFKSESPGQVSFNELLVPVGESAELFLSDSTHVWLNSGSKIIYPSSFNDESRDVKLSGEAFFDVAHNEKLPFHVITPQLMVEVKGTSFNVEAFEESDEVNVTLVEGKVNLKDSQGKIIAGLMPGQAAFFDLTANKVSVSQVETDYYTSWINGSLLFKDEKLEDIARKFERWFNIEIHFESDKMKEVKFTGSVLKNKPIDQILDILKYTSDITYSIEMKNNQPSKIYLKEKSMN